jgi:23S rRNA (guanosine2251-2'-O)-methyltransferase
MIAGAAMDKIIRINPLLEALRSAPERVNKVFVQEERGHARISEVIREAKSRHVPVVFVPSKRLDQVAPGHQGVMAEVSPKQYSTVADILARSAKSFVVILDEVEDPQNLGAIIRSAEGAGADGLILPERRSAGLTEAVDQVSAGALEHLPVARVPNLVRAMEQLKEKGLWLVGAEGSGDEPWCSFDLTGPIGIVLGSEGKGLRPLVRKTCDKILAIPLAGRVSSLNVAAAAAVFLFEVVRQRRGLKTG